MFMVFLEMILRALSTVLAVVPELYPVIGTGVCQTEFSPMIRLWTRQESSRKPLLNHYCSTGWYGI